MPNSKPPSDARTTRLDKRPFFGAIPSSPPAMKSISLITALLAVPLLSTGCGSTQRMRLHVAVADVDDPNPAIKFYRVNIRARSSNVKTDLQTGYYDANAVRQLYGEVKKPAEISNVPSKVGTHQFVYNSKNQRWEAMNDDQLFTVVFGADAKAIAAEIRTFAESDQTGQQMALLIAAAAGQDLLVEAVAAEQLEAEQRAKVKALNAALEECKTEADKLTDAVTPEELGQLLLKAAQNTSTLLGATAKFRTDKSNNGFQDAIQMYTALKGSK